MNSSEFFTTGEVNLTNCDREAIHLSGQIQPHGVLIVIKESELKIVQISENTDFFFGIPASSLINQPLQKLFPQSQIDILVPLLLEENLEIVNPIKLTSKINNKKHFFECVVHRSDKLIVLEMEPLSKDSSSNLDFYHLAKASALKIRKANDFFEMSDLLVKEKQKITSPQTLNEVVKEESNENRAKSTRILLAEDNSFNQMIALRLLAKLGYHADCALNGLEVLKAIEQKTYDLILMDIQMPEMDGLEATRQIRQMESARGVSNLTHQIKIVAMTANVMNEDRENCLKVGMNDFISKPVRIEEVAKTLKKWQF